MKSQFLILSNSNSLELGSALEILHELFADIKELRNEMTAFTEAWQQAKGVVTFVKWVVSIAGGVTAFLLFIRDHIK